MLGTESQLELEKWMKLLACASYDFMKLMVGELKHKINEIESRVGEEDEEGKPRPPPRSRHNPFNKKAGGNKVHYLPPPFVFVFWGRISSCEEGKGI